MSFTWIFKVKYGICYISAQNGAIATQRKANISIDLKTLNKTIRFDLEFSRSNLKFAISQPKVAWSIATKRKANILIELWASNVTNGFDLGHDLDIWIFKVICDLDHLVTKVRCKDLPDSDRGDFRCRRAINSSSFIHYDATHSFWFTPQLETCTNWCLVSINMQITSLAWQIC